MEKVSAIAVLTVSPVRRRVRLYFSLLKNRNVRVANLERFLSHLTMHIRGPIVLIWDGLQAHRGTRMGLWLERHPRVKMEFFPPYAPELNPVELFWSFLKYHRMANYAAMTVQRLASTARRHACSVSRDFRILRSFIRGTALSSCLD
jgi:putative transposase